MLAPIFIIFFESISTPPTFTYQIDPFLVASDRGSKFVAYAKASNWTATARPGMTEATDLRTAIDDTVEIANVTFDFGPRLSPGVTITAVNTTTCSVYVNSQVQDSQASTRITGSASIVASPSTGQPSQAVIIPVGTCVARCNYLLQANVATSDGQTLNLTTHLTCRARI